MLTDTKLKNLKPQDKLYKVSDRDGLYVAVLTSGSVSFRYDYRINGRRETLVIGQYGRDGISLAEAREELIAAKKLLKAGQSPAAAKRDGIKKIRGAETFAVHTDSYMKHVILADSTRAMKQAVIERDIMPVLGNKMMAEITTGMVRDLCDRIVERGGRATAVQAREIISSVYRYANDRGHGLFNPAADIKPSSIAMFKPRERTLSPEEVGIFFRALDDVGAMGTMKMAIKLVLLTMVRKNEFISATWSEIDFTKWTWTIPVDRMKAGRAHVIYLPKQAQDLLVGLQMCAGGSEYLVPGRYNFRKPLSNAALNSLIDRTVEAINKDDEKIHGFTVHDLRRTASTLLHEAGYPSDWIEKALAHEQKGVRAVYNKAEYARQRAYMLQQWADMVDAWINGEHTDLVPFSPSKFEVWQQQK
ncbi:site-specific integrase [Salmonella enterica subsp. enterica serovar Weltevreden]|uniref:tyrosine-type recombinase/integrase n=1 Tax=Enterobacteriaceae TaxID=543 RepID=UPI0006D4A953|nr:site-specific integrase [Salmonella enterica]ECI4709995.1 site-specific integrase [Salmonella enterica subsp. enterica]EDA0970147.1 tyrosine-type recombinase/integrase [Salmonella enterica subsp. enterica serovar Give]EDV4002256.1 tyrosine-type recombinase/integrase [Salmonella enterica subsp. enterica serovar Newbrunswick]EKF5694938.1 tyrosine-type recombinase/integrase [Salmonella enterica subsp. enterica serovar Anatum]EAQ6281923.1 site-specific integrase [Salmonella enterica]